MRTGAIFDEAAEPSSKDAENIGEAKPTVERRMPPLVEFDFRPILYHPTVYRVSKTFLLLFLLPGRRAFPDTLLRVPASRFFFRYTQIF